MERIFNDLEIILMEGAFVERLKIEFDLELDFYLNHAGLIYSNPEILEKLYRQYINIGKKYDLPIMVMTPTRKVNYESIQKSVFKNQNLIPDSFSFLKRIKESYGDYSGNILLGGLLGCKGDAYNANGNMSIEESFQIHVKQALQFKKEKADFLFAGIMPELNEAIGMCMAMAETKIPYIISFMIRDNGCLLDGTSISDAIKIIDEEVNPKPLCFMSNCVHPTILIKALENKKNKLRPELLRFKGIQANASVLSPEELNNCSILHKDDFEIMIIEMKLLQSKFGFQIFGGCCGTNDKFIDELSATLLGLKSSYSVN